MESTVPSNPVAPVSKAKEDQGKLQALVIDIFQQHWGKDW